MFCPGGWHRRGITGHIARRRMFSHQFIIKTQTIIIVAARSRNLLRLLARSCEDGQNGCRSTSVAGSKKVTNGSRQQIAVGQSVNASVGRSAAPLLIKLSAPVQDRLDPWLLSFLHRDELVTAS